MAIRRRFLSHLADRFLEFLLSGKQRMKGLEAFDLSEVLAKLGSPALRIVFRAAASIVDSGGRNNGLGVGSMWVRW
jgi:hypothetical protein